jgi:hypothetical protein
VSVALPGHVSGFPQKAEIRSHLGCVNEQIDHFAASNVLVLVGDIGKDDSFGDLGACPLDCHLSQMRLARCWEAKKPQDRVGHLRQDAEPYPEDERVNLSAHELSEPSLTDSRKSEQTL